MIIFAHCDDKSLLIIEELKKLNIEADVIKAKHPVLTPFYLLKLLMQGKKIKVYVFRYLNDSNSFILAVLRLVSEAFTILLLKIFNINIWWLCHNIDKETAMFFPKLSRIRRKNVVKFSSLIFTTNELLIHKAQEFFPGKTIDSLSLGYIDNGFQKIRREQKNDLEILEWIKSRKDSTSKFIFCIGSPAKKSLHFKLIHNFIEKLNVKSKYAWYAIVIGAEVEAGEYIYNIPYKLSIDLNIIKNNANFYYRVIDDYSMSYSIYEAAQLRIPIITEDYGIMPNIINEYKLGVVIESYDDLSQKIESYNFNEENFAEFINENNWTVTAEKIKNHYDVIIKR